MLGTGSTNAELSGLTYCARWWDASASGSTNCSPQTSASESQIVFLYRSAWCISLSRRFTSEREREDVQAMGIRSPALASIELRRAVSLCEEMGAEEGKRTYWTK